eukprot:TRINITY_DN49872_c0_g1_i1.p1 TRINITY_DN49872_c0_g1~~TRINITY_DN49872_c0_g1_i1.p1  ORF type:complete len:247 (-),score=69.76 TRINITY_DN49872_c0_g1_i1:83-760(-)
MGRRQGTGQLCLTLLVAAACVAACQTAVSFVAPRMEAPPRRRVQLRAATIDKTESDNFIDKAFTAVTDILVSAMPLAQQEKDAYQFYRNGMQFQASGDYSQALRAYAEALKIEEDPIDRSYIFYNLGIIFGSNGEYVKAVKYYHLALDQNKMLPQAYNNIAVIYHDQASRAERKGSIDKSTVLYEKAAQYWNQALSLNPTNYLEARDWLFQTGRLNKALMDEFLG